MEKKLLSLILLFCFVSGVYAQQYMFEKITLPATNEAFGIYVNINVNENVVVRYDLQTPNENQRARAELSSSEVSSLVSSLKKAKNFYTEWTKIAKEKGLTLLSKRIPVSFADQTIYFTQDNKWYYENGVDMSSTFMVDKDGTCLFILESDYMTSNEVAGNSLSVGLSFTNGLFSRMGVSSSQTEISLGRYCGGSSLTFSSVKEIDEFINKMEAAVKWKEQNLSNGKLFK